MKKRIYRQSDMTAHPKKYPQGVLKIKECKWCRNEFQPMAPSHLFCSDVCKDTSYTDSYFQQKYGISYAEVLNLIEKQNGVCAICKTEGFKMHRNSWSGLNVDHDHVTGVVRGMLCHNCNRALGLLQDDPEILQTATDYLKGATTISKESTYKCTEARDIER